jgi:hypothetical protein
MIIKFNIIIKWNIKIRQLIGKIIRKGVGIIIVIGKRGKKIISRYHSLIITLKNI